MCIRCQKRLIEGDQLNHVGIKFHDDQHKQYPIDILISYAEKLKIEALVSILKYNKENKVSTYIHLSCRNRLKNKSRKKQTFKDEHLITTKRTCRRSEIEKFDFTKQCFYCGKVCFFGSKHPDRNLFGKVATKATGINRNTLELCKFRKDDTKSNSTERRLLRYLLFAIIIVKRFQDLQIFVTDSQKPQTSRVCLNQNHEVKSFILLNCHFS